MDSSSALSGQPRQGPSPLLSPLNGVTSDHGDQGFLSTHKIPRSTLQGGSETILIIDGILERLNMANPSIKQQVRDVRTNRIDFGNEQELQSQNGVLLPLGYSNNEQQNPEHLDLRSFDIPNPETLTPLFKEYEDTMEFIRRLFPTNQPRPERPEPRDFSRHSRLIDYWVEIERDPAGQGSWFSHVFTNTGLRRLWNRYVGHRDDPRTQEPLPTPSAGRTLMSLPVEILTMIIDQTVLNDLDRLKFSATCARGMSVALPVLYKYAMVRYPIQKRPLNETLKSVGHMVRELVIHVPEDADPVRDEDDFIDPYEIFDKMPSLTALTLYFDAPVSPVEVSALLKYFLRTKDRLSHVTLDIKELCHPLAAYESRTVYHASRAAEALRASGAYTTGARLKELSLCTQQCPPDTSAAAVRQVFTRHCEDAKYLRILPYVRNRETLDLAPFRSRKADHIQFIVREGMTISVYAPVLQAAADSTTLKYLRIFAYTRAQFILDHMGGSEDPAREFPFSNLVQLRFDCVQAVPPDESFCHNPDLQQLFLERAEQIFRGAPKLGLICCVERVDGFAFELRAYPGVGPRGSRRLVTAQY
ncbi:uncharacterized protein DFL_009717 [Arthrobotrys flagrans]|uniref:F-box domain-containing protein n=1 Tax=Arthrobotrys flagrans TaxID=97331 RepID=A0A436ZSF1_ARTFL|nr:hypothetical protein DFL_009717 [Arthrobotrys flagrans]